MTIVGVLALQGDVPEHQAAFARVVGPESVRLVRTPKELAGVDALVIPGGESTTISEMLNKGGLRLALAERLEPSPGGHDPEPVPVLDVSVRRNDYGRQRESFEAPVRIEGISGLPFPGVFIRAPRILDVGRSAKPFAWRDQEVVGVRSGPIWGLTFHPELSADRRLAEAFLATAVGSPPKGKTTPRGVS
ncbi:MAG TPA: pyridoxal 5'-phosphate synthase glutaminase subunit PdxT [Thermoplasmata archaeon]|nr:pyridoxal 5'-phosphate synthase glutaminase subunit PdxT [Thermoplasmata archaeon]